MATYFLSKTITRTLKYLEQIMSQIHKLKVQSVVNNTNDTITIAFEIPTHLKSEFDYEPGQYLTIEIMVDGKKERRAYSMCSSPLTDVYPAVTVKRLEGGLVSNYLNDHVKAGSELNVLPPYGNFTVNLNPDNAKNYLLIGAGSGITPLMSITKSILNLEPNSTVSLLYGNRTEESIIFYKELNELRNQNQGKLNIIHTLSQAKGLWFGETGRIDAEKVKGFVNSFANSDGHKEYFLCGPGELIKLAEATLSEMGIGEQFIHKEYFVLPAKEQTKANTATAASTATEAYEVKIIVDKQEHVISVKPNETILDAALDENIDVPFSCMSAACATCRCKLEAGTVEMEDSEILSKKEKAQNFVLSCQAHPTSAGVVLNFDV